MTLVPSTSVGGGSSAGALAQIYDNIAAGAIASWDVTGIAATYTHLRIVIACRGDNAATSTLVCMRFNNDSGANYDHEIVQGTMAVAPASAGTEANSVITFAACPAATAPASHIGAYDITVADYAGTTFFKGGTATGGARSLAATNFTATTEMFQWRNTGAINRITVLPSPGNFVAGSRLTIYGLT